MKLTKKEILAWFKMVRQQPVRDNYVEILLNIEQELNVLFPEERIKYDIQTIIKAETDTGKGYTVAEAGAGKGYTVLRINHAKWKHPLELYFFKGECFKIAGY